MKYALILTLSALLLSENAIAQTPAALPAGAKEWEARALTRIGAKTRVWIRQEALRESAGSSTSRATAVKAILSEPWLELPDGDIESLALLVMMAGARLESEMTKAMLDSLKRNEEVDGARRQKSLRLQMALDRRSRLIADITRLLKKSSAASAAITGNLK